ncbi:MAG: hypothetical protein ACTSQE_04765 [Candidatus Heimdallarchaeaceae archaeon]
MDITITKKNLLILLIISLFVNGVLIGLYTTEKMKESKNKITQITIYDIGCLIKDSYNNTYLNDTYIPTYNRLFTNGTKIYNSSEERIGLKLIIKFQLVNKEIELINMFHFSPLLYNFSYNFYLSEFFLLTDVGIIYPQKNHTSIPITLKGYAINYGTNETMYGFIDSIAYYNVDLFKDVEVIIDLYRYV